MSDMFDEREDWKAIRFSTDADDFDAFLARHPDGTWSAEARNRLARIDWQTVEAAPDLAAYDRFLAAHGDSHFAMLARTRREILAERDVREKRYQTYLARERAAWINAQASGSLDSLDHFLRSFPRGPHAAEAAEERARLVARLDTARERYTTTNYVPHILTVVVMVVFWLMSRLEL